MRRLLPALIVPAALLAACGDQVTPEEQAMKDQRDVAMVERANAAAPPVQDITPEPISPADMERHDLYGAACNFAPGTSFGTRVIARDADAWMKIKGDMVRFAADPGSRELAAGVRSLYSGKAYAVQLAIKGEGKVAGQSKDYEGTVTVRDAYGREIYEGTGLTRCDS
jgi:hypothetical protein